MPDNFALNIVLADVGPIQMELMQPLGKNPPHNSCSLLN
jgi:hypothetical protein